MPSLTKHLTKHGNSYAIIIDRAIMDLLKIDPTTPLEISTSDGESLIITPQRSSTRKDRKSVVQGKSVDLGGRRIIKKKKNKK